jgi:hypothetical protein
MAAWPGVERRALETGDVPCALFAHAEEVEEIAKRTGAYKTDGD